MKKLPVIFFIISLIVPAAGQTCFLPFVNNTQYNGSWKLATDFPDALAKFLRQKTDSATVTATSFGKYELEEKYRSGSITEMEDFQKLAQLTGQRFFVSGSIEKFDINRYMIEEPSTIGYEYYTCEISARIKVVDASVSLILVNDLIEVSESRNGLGINLLGKPSDNKSQFLTLDKIAFGSEEFLQTLPGISSKIFFDKFFGLLASSVYFKQQLKPNATESIDGVKAGNDSSVTATVVYADTLTGECYLAIARELIKQGDVFRAGDIHSDEYIELTILEIKGDNLAFGIAGKGKKRVKNGIKLLKVIKKG